MIGRVAEIAVGDKLDQVVLGVPHRVAGAGLLALVHAGVQDAPRHRGVIKDALAVAPAVGGKEQRHRKELLAVRRRAPGILGPVRLAGPGKVPGVLAFVHIHVGHDPAPQAVELLLAVHLHAEHHAVAHALGAGVVVAGVLHVAHVVPDRVVDAPVLRPVKHGLEGLLQLAAHRVVVVAERGKTVGVHPCLKRSLHKVVLSFIPYSSFGGCAAAARML